MHKVATLILLAGRDVSGRRDMRDRSGKWKLARHRPSRGIGRMRSDHVQRLRGPGLLQEHRAWIQHHAGQSTCRGGGWNARSWLGFRTRHAGDQQGTVVSVVDQGGEPHTFTEVKAFGNGFLPPLNPGGATSVIPECSRWLFQRRSRQDPNPSGQPRSISPACRRESICSNAASIPGCGWKWT